MNKLVGAAVFVVGWIAVSYMTSNGYGNVYAGFVLNLATGMLSGHLCARR